MYIRCGPGIHAVLFADRNNFANVNNNNQTYIYIYIYTYSLFIYLYVIGVRYVILYSSNIFNLETI
jgi:hypothetical protein